MKKLFKRKNEKGFAILEAVVFLVAFMVVAVYTIDFFTAIHTGVLGSIHSRTYLFETLRHRADIDELRPGLEEKYQKYFANPKESHERFHVIQNEEQNDDNTAQVVPRALTRVENIEKGSTGVGSLRGAKQSSVIYIKSGYGICTDSQCRKDGG